MMLADAGADVLRIERRRPAGEPADLIERGRRGNAVTRSRRSIGLDLKQPAAQAFVLELVVAADIVLEGYRPGVAERLGIGPDACLAANPAVVYGRLTGWGRSGPLADRAGHDINYLALSGTLGAIGPADAPPPIPLNLIADFGGGSMQLAFGVLAALTAALRTGQGQVVDAAMIDGAASLATYVHSMRAAGTWVDDRQSNVLDGGAPFYAVYATADGGYVAVGAIEPQFYTALVAGLGLQVEELPPQLDRSQWSATKQVFSDRFASKTRDDWERHFEGTDACVTPVLTMAEAPQHTARPRTTFSTSVASSSRPQSRGFRRPRRRCRRLRSPRVSAGAAPCSSGVSRRNECNNSSTATCCSSQSPTIRTTAMPIDLECVGRKTDYRASWTSTEALLYALGVGAGTNEPAYTTENTKASNSGCSRRSPW